MVFRRRLESGGDKPGALKFENAYRAEYGTPSDLAAVSAYDAVYVFKQVMKTSTAHGQKRYQRGL
jgi:ABC-type branched-subunit amino acid transport system substrate-binding protein